MSSKFVEQQNEELSQLLNDTEKVLSEKKPLRNVLSSYMKTNQINEKSIKKVKKEFLDIKNNMNEAKTSFETLMDIQKKLSKVYNNLSEKDNEQKKTEKKN